MSHPYVTLAHRGDVIARLVATFVSAVPIGMLTLTTVLAVRGWTGSYAAAGFVAGAFGIGNAAGLAVQGRLLGRFGARRVIAVAGAACILALAAFGLAGQAGAPVWLLAVLIVAGGGTLPSITAATRGWLPTHISQFRVRTAAYSLMSVLFQSALAVGPLLVGAAVVAGPPVLSLVGAGALVLIATVLHTIAARSEPRPVPLPAGTTAGPLGFRFWTLLPVPILTFFCFGVLDVALPALHPTHPAAATLLFTSFAIGQGIGALLYGARPLRPARWLQLAVALLVAAALFVVITAAAEHQAILIPIFAVAGMLFAPVSILPSMMLDDLMPDASVARGYATLVSAGLVTSALGAAVAGALVAVMGAQALLLLPAAALALAAGWTVLRRRVLGLVGPLGAPATSAPVPSSVPGAAPGSAPDSVHASALHPAREREHVPARVPVAANRTTDC